MSMNDITMNDDYVLVENVKQFDLTTTSKGTVAKSGVKKIPEGCTVYFSSSAFSIELNDKLYKVVHKNSIFLWQKQ